ncbi:MAG: hypothetical protein IKI11_03540 [Neisseriaceae bacterium]|nr:hypothetical protein [Neisseriaceae bacterium]
MANNGRGENEQKNNFSGSLKALPVQEIRHCEQSEAICEKSPDFSGSLSEQRFPNNAQTTPDGVIAGLKPHPTAEENDYRVGIPAHQNAAGVDNENISGSLSEQRHPNKSATPIYSEIASPVTQARNDDNGSLKQENQSAVGWATQATNNAAGVDNENVSGSLKDNHNTQETPDGVAAAKNAHPIQEETPNGVIGGSKTHPTVKENTPLDLPELTPDNWHIIVQKLTPQLGANVLLAQHSSLIKVEQQKITLSVHKSGELFCKPAHLSALGEVLAQHYSTQQKIQLIEWQDNFESASQAKQRHKEEEQQQRLQTLQQDPFAQKLQQVFGGVWSVK